jgi:hypothetical protein
VAFFARLSLILCVGCLSGLYWARSTSESLGRDIGLGMAEAASLLMELASGEPRAMADPIGSLPMNPEPATVRNGATGEGGAPGEALRQLPLPEAVVHPVAAGAAAAGGPEAPAPPTFLLTADTVVRLAEQGLRPRARPVPAEGERPAGLRLSSVSALGLPLRDGDVLTHVAGQPVTSEGDVVGLVLALRGQRVPRVSATVWQGLSRIQVLVEQPYLSAREPLPGREPGVP